MPFTPTTASTPQLSTGPVPVEARLTSYTKTPTTHQLSTGPVPVEARLTSYTQSPTTPQLSTGPVPVEARLTSYTHVALHPVFPVASRVRKATVPFNPAWNSNQA